MDNLYFMRNGSRIEVAPDSLVPQPSCGPPRLLTCLTKRLDFSGAWSQGCSSNEGIRCVP